MTQSTDPGVYSRVSDEFDWIKEQVCAMSPNDAPEYFGCANVEPPVGAVGGSCANSCGGQSLTPDATCYCDAACVELEDCCFDALEQCPIEFPPPATNTCAGQCDGPSLDGSCYCDEACVGIGDCCSDKVGYCPLAATPPTPAPVVEGTCDGSCGGASTTPGATCYCDFHCIAVGDCCNDVPSYCPAESGTCDGACGGQSLTDGATCYCDEACTAFEDCCFDAGSTCKAYIGRRELDATSRRARTQDNANVRARKVRQ